MKSPTKYIVHTMKNAKEKSEIGWKFADLQPFLKSVSRLLAHTLVQKHNWLPYIYLRIQNNRRQKFSIDLNIRMSLATVAKEVRKWKYEIFHRNLQ
jgi:hypothetical protein